MLKPGVEDVLTTDLIFLYVAARVLEFLNPQFARVSLVSFLECLPSHCILYDPVRSGVPHSKPLLSALGDAFLKQKEYNLTAILSCDLNAGCYCGRYKSIHA